MTVKLPYHHKIEICQLQFVAAWEEKYGLDLRQPTVGVSNPSDFEVSWILNTLVIG